MLLLSGRRSAAAISLHDGRGKPRQQKARNGAQAPTSTQIPDGIWPIAGVLSIEREKGRILNKQHPRATVTIRS